MSDYPYYTIIFDVVSLLAVCIFITIFFIRKRILNIILALSKAFDSPCKRRIKQRKKINYNIYSIKTNSKLNLITY